MIRRPRAAGGADRRPWTALLAAAALVGAAAIVTPSTASGYTAKITNSTDTAATNPYFQCASMLSGSADGANALFVWPLADASATAADASGHSRTGAYNGTFTTSAATPKACPRDSGSVSVFDGSTAYLDYATQQTNPLTFSLEVWFKSTSTTGGMLVGFGNAATGTSGNYDRHIYFAPSGQLVFGIYNGACYTVTSPSAYNDGNWHQVVATLGASGTTYQGMRLYVDGALVASDSTHYTPQVYNGYWRVGYDNMSGWPTNGTNAYFAGSMRYASVFSTVLTPTQVAQHYGAGSGS